MSIHDRIKRARLEAGLSQRRIAQLVKGTEASIIRYESGQARPRPARLKALAEATNKPISYFLEDDFSVPSTSEQFQSSGFGSSYRLDSVAPEYIREADPSYLNRIINILSRIEKEVQALSTKIDILVPQEKRPARRKKK